MFLRSSINLYINFYSLSGNCKTTCCRCSTDSNFILRFLRGQQKFQFWCLEKIFLLSLLSLLLCLFLQNAYHGPLISMFHWTTIAPDTWLQTQLKVNMKETKSKVLAIWTKTVSRLFQMHKKIFLVAKVPQISICSSWIRVYI